VFLKGPIEIRDDRGVFVDSFNKEVVCMIKYDQIVTCDDRGPMIPDAVASAVEAVALQEAVANANANTAHRNQGGKRSTRSRSKPKRKTRRTKRRV